jgi:hypothetical protein
MCSGRQEIDALERSRQFQARAPRDDQTSDRYDTRTGLLPDPECDSLLPPFAVASRQFDDDVLNLIVDIEPDASRKLYKALSGPVPPRPLDR